MEQILLVFASNLPIAHKWYTALLGFPPIEEINGTRYRIGKDSLLLSTTGRQGPITLLVPSISDVRRRFTKSNLNPNEVLAVSPDHDEDESASFRDPSGNLVILANLHKLIK